MPRWHWPSSFITRWLSIFKMAKLHTCLVSTFCWQLIWEDFHKFFTTAWQRTQRSSCCACGGSGGRKNRLRHFDQPASQRGETIMIVILKMFNITFVLLGYICCCFWCIICSKANWIIWCSPSKYLMLDVLQQSTWCFSTKYLIFSGKRRCSKACWSGRSTWSRCWRRGFLKRSLYLWWDKLDKLFSVFKLLLTFCHDFLRLEKLQFALRSTLDLKIGPTKWGSV